ncbi:MAG TPA: ferritin-like domain-containing protein [Polyangiaceae bacterium]
MTFVLQRTSDVDGLSLTQQHAVVAAPRKGRVDWASFDASAYAPDVLDRAARLWSVRATQEFHSLTLFTELAGKLQVLGAPLDWSGAFARMIADEVRHTDLCMRLCEALGRPMRPDIDETALLLAPGDTLRVRVRDVVIAAFCIGETISGRMFKRALRAATVPVARDVVEAIVVDETFHGELGWELGALLMRDVTQEEHAALAARLPRVFAHYARLCLATRGRVWAMREPQEEPAPNFGALTEAGYARAFYEGMEEDVVPGLVAIGLPEAEAAWAEMVASG